jgi:hypothetical protein
MQMCITVGRYGQRLSSINSWPEPKHWKQRGTAAVAGERRGTHFLNGDEVHPLESNTAYSGTRTRDRKWKAARPPGLIYFDLLIEVRNMAMILQRYLTP